MVEDEAALRKMFYTFFKAEGYYVEVASTVEEAEYIIDTELIDLIISDLKLGLKSAYELYEWLTAKYPGMKDRFIVMSGWPDVEGFPFFLPKPFRIDEMLDLARQALSQPPPEEASARESIAQSQSG